jgi:hypothetical protein
MEEKGKIATAWAQLRLKKSINRYKNALLLQQVTLLLAMRTEFGINFSSREPVVFCRTLGVWKAEEN